MLCSMALPGHRKHTNDTKINCDSGEAYQGRVNGPSFKDLYFHPFRTPFSLESTESTGHCAYVAVGPFLASAMGVWELWMNS